MRYALILAVAACGKSPPKSEPAPPKPEPADCKAQVDELMKFLRAMDHTPSLFYVENVHLALRPELPYVMGRQAPMVTVRPAGIEYQGETLAPAALATKLAEDRKKIDEDMARGMFPKHDPPDPLLIDVVIDAGTPWRDVVALADILVRTGFPHASFVFGKPPPVSPPPRTWVDDKVDVLRKDHTGNAATELANMVSKIIPGCPQLISVYGNIGSTESDDKAGEIIEGSGPAILACNCNLDVPAYRSALWAIAGNPQPSTVLSVELGKTGKPLALPAATPWSEAGKQLAAGTVWFVVR